MNLLALAGAGIAVVLLLVLVGLARMLDLGDDG